MRKYLFSFILALYAIHVSATTSDKLPAFVIDTLYESGGTLVIEYEVLRPFDRVSLSVQSSWEQASKNDKPVLLSCNVGKNKASVPVYFIPFTVGFCEKEFDTDRSTDPVRSLGAQPVRLRSC